MRARHVPLTVQKRRPRAPWGWRVEKAPSSGMIVSQGHQIPLDSGVVHDVYPLAVRRIVKHRASARDIRRPDRSPASVDPFTKLPGFALTNPVLRYSCQHHTVVAFVRRRPILRVGVNKAVARARIVSSEIEKSRRSKAGLHLESPLPRLAPILRPQQLRIRHVTHPQVENSDRKSTRLNSSHAN